MSMIHGNMNSFGGCHFSGSANANHAPFGYEGAVTSDLGLALLHRITGASTRG
mgnify:CR=1 FL=1